MHSGYQLAGWQARSVRASNATKKKSNSLITNRSTAFLTISHRFGQVISGQDVMNAIEQVGSENGKTRVAVEIADCGQLR
jgi:cyclophilin family peptidyl-prolyl cis-trans isomerase